MPRGERDEGRKTLLVFISHSHHDYETATFIKQELERWGISAFVAHLDIVPSRAWRQEIRAQLEACSLIVALLTKAFRASKWTDQECGIAMALGKRILPVQVDHEPYGFLADHQALKWDEDEKWESRRELIRVVLSELDVPARCLVQALVTAPSFDDAGFAIGELTQRTNLSNDDINQIAVAWLENRQVRESDSAREGMRWFFQVYESRIDPKVSRQIQRTPIHPSRAAVAR